MLSNLPASEGINGLIILTESLESELSETSKPSSILLKVLFLISKTSAKPSNREFYILFMFFILSSMSLTLKFSILLGWVIKLF